MLCQVVFACYEVAHYVIRTLLIVGFMISLLFADGVLAPLKGGYLGFDDAVASAW